MNDDKPTTTGGPYKSHIREERIAAGFKSQEEFAKAAGIEPSWFVRIENGRALAGPDELDAISNTLGGIPLTRLYEQVFLEAIGAARRAARIASTAEQNGSPTRSPS